MKKYSFRKYCNLIGFIEIEADSDVSALEKYKKTRLSDYKWKDNPTKKDRTTYEVAVDDSLSTDRKE
tara:strand:- start:516 stop:716 length:201 start_codon:yes stop_codon:yes gene_type:complete